VANLTFTHCEDFGEAIRLQAPWIRHVHVKDLVFTDPSRPGSAAAVATVSMDGHANIAAANRHCARDPQRGLHLLQTA
jgi:sugar phosphate isomerase/epimerase